MVHLLPLPGSPLWQGSMQQVLERAAADARTYAAAGFHAIMVENYGDAPFAAGPVAPHTVAAMARVMRHLHHEVTLPMGVNVLRNDWQSALALASVCGGRFIRVNVHTGAMLTDQGVISGNAHDCLRYRKALEASHIGVWADLWVKHAVPLSRDLDLIDCAHDAARRGLADGLIITGKRTGEAARMEELIRIKQALPDVPLLAGSGIDEGNIGHFAPLVDGMIVGTSVKEEQITHFPVSLVRAQRLMAVLQHP
jgi:membrane complex biogenesis BtpA family protein